jgi:hypothetical protein
VQGDTGVATKLQGDRLDLGADDRPRRLSTPNLADFE